MTHQLPTDTPALGTWIARVLRIGTLLSMTATAIGYAVAVLGGEPAQRTERLTEALASGGGHALIGVGLLALTVLPGATLVAAALAFARTGESRMLATALGVIGLLVASVVGSLLLAGNGI